MTTDKNELDAQFIQEYNELMLRQAARLAAREHEKALDLLGAEPDDGSETSPSEEFERKMQTLIRQAEKEERAMERKRRRSARGHRLRSLAAMAAFVFLLGTGAAAVRSDALWESFRYFLYRDFGLYTDISYSPAVDPQYREKLVKNGWTEIYYPEYMPGDYVLSDLICSPKDYILQFENPQIKSYIKIIVFDSTSSHISGADTENAYVESLDFESNDSFYVEKNNIGLLIYLQDKKLIKVESNYCKKAQLLHIAEHMGKATIGP